MVAEDEPTRASAEYKKWRSEKIGRYLEENVDNNASDHSTTMTNPKHARLALAYDVAVGVCNISPNDLRKLREIADWRLPPITAESLRKYYKYFEFGKIEDVSVSEWAQSATSEGTMPQKIADRREYQNRSHNTSGGGSETL